MPGVFPWVQCSSLLLVCAASAPRGLLTTLEAAGGDAEVARAAAQEALLNMRDNARAMHAAAAKSGKGKRGKRKGKAKKKGRGTARAAVSFGD